MADKQEVPQIEVEARDLGTLTELDPSTLDPGYVYRWVHKLPLKVARAKAKGYELVKPSEEQILNVVGDSPEAEDGTYTLGDVVLMRVKKLTESSTRRLRSFRRKRRLLVKSAESKSK
jgi:hypothetical protein